MIAIVESTVQYKEEGYGRNLVLEKNIWGRYMEEAHCKMKTS